MPWSPSASARPAVQSVHTVDMAVEYCPAVQFWHGVEAWPSWSRCPPVQLVQTEEPAACDAKTCQGYHHMSVPATSTPQTCACSYQDYHMARKGFGLDAPRTAPSGSWRSWSALSSRRPCRRRSPGRRRRGHCCGRSCRPGRSCTTCCWRRNTCLREWIVFGADFRPLSSCQGLRLLSIALYHSDSVTRDRPVALRVRAAQTETRNGRWAGRAVAAHRARRLRRAA